MMMMMMMMIILMAIKLLLFSFDGIITTWIPEEHYTGRREIAGASPTQ